METLHALHSVFILLAGGDAVYSIVADVLAGQILEISDDGANDYTQTEDGNEVPNHEHVQRSRLIPRNSHCNGFTEREVTITKGC